MSGRLVLFVTSLAVVSTAVASATPMSNVGFALTTPNTQIGPYVQRAGVDTDAADKLDQRAQSGYYRMVNVIEDVAVTQVGPQSCSPFRLLRPSV